MNDLKEEIKKTYDLIASDYNEEFHEIAYINLLDNFIETIKNKDEILDLGCGIGKVTYYLENKGCNVTGIDYSKEMIKIAKNKCKKSNFIIEDIEHFNFVKNKYNGIIATYLLIHFKKEGWRNLLIKFYGSLNDNGLILLSFLEGNGEDYGPEPLNPDLNMYFCYTNKEEIEIILGDVGFKIISIDQKHRKTKNMDYTAIYVLAKK